MYIHAIRTLNPPYALDQTNILEFMTHRMAMNPEENKFLKKIYEGSAIQRRHSVLPDYGKIVGQEGDFLPADSQLEPFPGTGARNDIFAAAAEALGVGVCGDLLNLKFNPKVGGPPNAFPGDGSQALPGPQAGELSPDFDPGKITHLVSFSCTGFTAPGFEMSIQKALGLRENLQRFHLGFMGCYASFPALRLAHSLCQSNPGAVVLVVGVELCTLHFQKTKDMDNMVANALFADGAYALLVSSQPGHSQKAQPLYSLEGFLTQLIPGSEERMAWDIGDHGFEMKLSSYVPRLIEGHLPDLAKKLRETWNLGQADILHWAVHPGGRAILDRVKDKFELKETQLRYSYKVLQEFGNMSAATFGFLLAELASSDAIPGPVFGAAFGPGLTVEAALLQLKPKISSQSRTPVLQGAVSHKRPWRLRAGILSPDLPLIWPNTSKRWVQEELMDRPEVDKLALWRTVRQFTHLNRLFSSYKGLLKREILNKMTDKERTYTLADVGAGGGDIALWLAKEARSRGLKLKITALEPDCRILPWARLAAVDFPEITFIQGTAEKLDDGGPWDFIFCNHVMHHLTETQLKHFFYQASQARVNAVLSDLRRSRWAYWGYTLVSTLFFITSLVQYDGRLSILRGFHKKDLETLIRDAQVETKLEVRRAFPARLVITRGSSSF